MSNLDLHPDQGELLLYLDGELSGRKAKQIRSHLEACWQCRTELQVLEATVADCMKYRKDVVAEGLPPAPAQWKALDFDSVEAELASQSLWSRLAGWLSPRQPAMRWALTGAAAIALVFVAINKLNETPKVEAAALLKKAVAVTESRPHGAKRIRIATSRRQITRIVNGETSVPATGEAEIAAMFEAAHYDFHDPLSARAYSAWYGQLAHKQDAIDTEKDFYTIKTITDESEMVSATIKMRATDFEALQARFEFRDREWVEMTELVDQQTLPASTVAGTAAGAPRQPGAPAVTLPSVAENMEPSLYSEELQVFAALRKSNADLGDDIEVRREGRDVVVNGTAVPQQHQQQLHAMLDRLPHVTMRFNEPSLPASNPPAQEPVTRDAAGPEKPKYPARLEARLGGRPQFERFSGQILDWSEAVMSHVYALHRLALQFPAAAAASMRPDERATLYSLAQEHVTALAKDLRKIANTVNPVLNGMGERGVAPMALSSATWQEDAAQILATGRRVDTLLAGVLGVTSKAVAEDAPSQLLTGLAQLAADAEHCLDLVRK
ncbi:MAG TPA: zf-HC2 domain-containing protein [Candidatus Solibacter sp.]|nr:zf-HC2 domain-containing protein [Candidatus Solibacter sp.]